MIDYGKQVWDTLRALPSESRSDEVNARFLKHGKVIAQWLGGKEIEFKTDLSNGWKVLDRTTCTFSCRNSYRVLSPVKIELELMEEGCNRLLYLLENTNFPRKEDRDLRYKLMKAIETKLEQHSK